jgi:TRAP-type C4-dicarboxylate transport system permease small subunit
MEDLFTKVIEKVLKTANIVFLTVMTVTILIQVSFRYVLSNPLDWTEEVARLMLVWLTFSGATLIFIKLEHPSIDLFVKIFPPSIRHYLKILNFLLIGIFLAYALLGGIKVLKVSKLVSSVALGFPMTLVYLSFFINGILIFIYNTLFLWKTLKGEIE